jgi:NAD(P)H-flavin reductase
LLAFVAALNLECDQLNIVTAFLNSWLDNDKDIYICLPDGRLAKLRKALYGLRRPLRLWYEELARFLTSIGYKPLEADPCVFTNPSKGGILLAYVDDFVMITRMKDEMATLKKLIFSKFKCHNM